MKCKISNLSEPLLVADFSHADNDSQVTDVSTEEVFTTCELVYLTSI